MKFRHKIALCMICLMSLLLGAGGSFLISGSFSDSLDHERRSAYASYQSTLGMLQLLCTVKQSSDYDFVSEVLEQFSSQSGDRAALRLQNGNGIICQEGDIPPLDLVQTSKNCIIRQVDMDGNRYFAVSGSFDVLDEIWYLDILYDITPVFESLLFQLRIYSWVFLLLVVLCAILSVLISYALTRPLTKLSEISKDIASGQLSRRVQMQTADEIGSVAQDFNSMADYLEQNITELEDAVERQKRFTGSFAHEVKTPITSIVGYADLIRGGMLDTEEQRQAANFIFREGQRLDRLSQKLLQLQLLQNEKIILPEANPAALIQALAAEWAPVYEKQDITLCCRGEEGSCYLEPELVKTLLINLWDNARKAGAKRILVNVAMLSDGCRLSVQDDGQGIPTEALSRLTEAFYRVDRSRSRALGGAGLGLTLCQEIAALHNGSIQFTSEPGRGTTVTVDLRGGHV